MGWTATPRVYDATTLPVALREVRNLIQGTVPDAAYDETPAD
jgi:hypothetical protein